METTFIIKGKIIFDPPDVTKKHLRQADWKKVAYVSFNSDICQYYQWFLKKRFNIILNDPIRGPHVTFINDSHRDMGKNVNKWETVKKKWDGKMIDIMLSVDIKCEGLIWWLLVPEEGRTQLHEIRAELGLGRPFFGLHMTIGNAVDTYDDDFETNALKAIRKNEDHSRYIHGLLTKGLIL